MRILILGAGALGGYFGGRLIEGAMAEQVAFLVRPGRKTQLDQDGLIIESPAAGDLRVKPVQTLLQEDAHPGWDVVLMTCKAYDLEDAIAAVHPAVDRRTAVLPVLNGLSHIERLEEAFGAGHVLGGLAQVSATLTPTGVVRHLTPHNKFIFGELDGRMSERVLALKAVFGGAPVEAEAVSDVRGQMWEKLVGLGTLAAATVLMRANIGEIARVPGGVALMERLLERSVAAAKAHGHPVRPAVLEGFFRPLLRDTSSLLVASMLRDLEAGERVEADHILGFMLDAVRRAGAPDELHEAAYLHAKAYENRRCGGRLPLS